MYEYLIPNVKATLLEIPAVKEVFAYPLPGSPTKYPAVIFFPDNFENSFETKNENFVVCRFKMYVVVNLSGTTEDTVFTSIMPKVVDAVIKKFNTKWNGTLEGHRVWSIIDSGFWTLSVEEKAKVATAELTLTVKLTTNN